MNAAIRRPAPAAPAVIPTNGSSIPGQFRTNRLGSGTIYNIAGKTIEILATAAETDEAMTLFVGDILPGDGMPPHTHSREDEYIVILAGTFTIRVGENEKTLTVGDYGLMPRGIPHSFRNVGDSTGRILCTATPGGMDRVFAELAVATSAPDAPPPGPQLGALIASITAKYGITQHG